MTVTPFEFVHRAPSPALRGVVARMTGYRERQAGDWRQREAASLTVPLIVSFGSPFRIALDREAGPDDRQPSFAAGLHAGPVDIRSDGGAACVQVDFTPLGAIGVFGGALPHLASRMVDLADVLGAPGRGVAERLAEAAGWEARFAVLEALLMARPLHDASPALSHAFARLTRSSGAEPIGALAEAVGWSRKHLAARFRAELGLGPKAIARIMRFQQACRLARGNTGGWAAVAADCGYADQAHLTREFAALAAETPRAWARRHALEGPALFAGE